MRAPGQDRRTRAELSAEIERLRLRSEEAEQTLDAIRRGDVDALVVNGPLGEQVYTLSGADQIYRVIVETMNEGALLVSPDGLIFFCNSRFCEMMHCTMRTVVGRSLNQFTIPMHEPALAKLLARGQEGPLTWRFTLQAPDGALVPVQFWASPLRSKAGPALCLVATDLTELATSLDSLQIVSESEQRLKEAKVRLESQANELQARTSELSAHQIELEMQNEQLRKAELALEESRTRYFDLYDLAPVGYLTLDAAGRIVEANLTAATLLGRTKQELIGRLLATLFVPEHRDTFHLLHRRLMSTAAAQGSELCLQRQDGAPSWARLEANVTPVRNAADAFRYVISDITDRKRAEEELRARNAELTEFNELMVDRELRMIELKREVNRLCARIGQTTRYDVSQEDPA